MSYNITDIDLIRTLKGQRRPAYIAVPLALFACKDNFYYYFGHSIC
ncbi:MAG: hypothetical protein H6Q70_1622 [Firmicutes bacterium]|nr:hypothetical protein [Bacillota bacterium]